MKSVIIGLVILVVSLAVGVSLAGAGIMSYDTLIGITVLLCVAIVYLFVAFAVDKPMVLKHFRYGESNRAV